MNTEDRVRAIVDEIADRVGLNSSWDPEGRAATLDSVARIATDADNTLTLTLYVNYLPTSVRRVQLAELEDALSVHVDPK